jgi:hypothetical protein
MYLLIKHLRDTGQIELVDQFSTISMITIAVLVAFVVIDRIIDRHMRRRFRGKDEP